MNWVFILLKLVMKWFQWQAIDRLLSGRPHMVVMYHIIRQSSEVMTRTESLYMSVVWLRAWMWSPERLCRHITAVMLALVAKKYLIRVIRSLIGSHFNTDTNNYIYLNTIYLIIWADNYSYISLILILITFLSTCLAIQNFKLYLNRKITYFEWLNCLFVYSFYENNTNNNAQKNAFNWIFNLFNKI